MFLLDFLFAVLCWQGASMAFDNNQKLWGWFLFVASAMNGAMVLIHLGF